MRTLYILYAASYRCLRETILVRGNEQKTIGKHVNQANHVTCFSSLHSKHCVRYCIAVVTAIPYCITLRRYMFGLADTIQRCTQTIDPTKDQTTLGFHALVPGEGYIILVILCAPGPPHQHSPSSYPPPSQPSHGATPGQLLLLGICNELLCESHPNVICMRTLLRLQGVLRTRQGSIPLPEFVDDVVLLLFATVHHKHNVCVSPSCSVGGAAGAICPLCDFNKKQALTESAQL